MIDIIEFKDIVNNKKTKDTIYIFEYKDVDFVVNEYLFQIVKDKNLSISYVDNLSKNNLFEDNKYCKINYVDIFNDQTGDFKNNINTFVICKDVENNTRKIYDDNIVVFPKLENWQIQDFVKQQLKKIDISKINWLCEKCSYDIYLLDNEIHKLLLFPASTQEVILNELIADDNFYHLNTKTIYDIVNAFIKKDKKTLISYLYTKTNEHNVFAIHSLLLKQFKYILMIQNNNRITANDLGISYQQFNVIKQHNCCYYSNEKIKKIYLFLLSINEKIKTGYIDQNMLLDYLIINILF